MKEENFNKFSFFDTVSEMHKKNIFQRINNDLDRLEIYKFPKRNVEFMSRCIDIEILHHIRNEK